MRFTGILLCTVLQGFCLTSQAQAKVYRYTDAEGNAIFSDQPTAQSEEVKVPQPNVGDAVELPPPAPVLEPKPELVIDKPPAAVEGELIGVKKKSSKRRRPRKEPRGHGR